MLAVVELPIVRFQEKALPGWLKGDFGPINKVYIDYEAGWGAAKVASAMTSTKLVELREKYSILDYIEILVPEAYERVCYPRSSCVAVGEFLLNQNCIYPCTPSLG